MCESASRLARCVPYVAAAAARASPTTAQRSRARVIFVPMMPPTPQRPRFFQTHSGATVKPVHARSDGTESRHARSRTHSAPNCPLLASASSSRTVPTNNEANCWQRASFLPNHSPAIRAACRRRRRRCIFFRSSVHAARCAYSWYSIIQSLLAAARTSRSIATSL